jgi:preprotein translocase subunit YajC
MDMQKIVVLIFFGLFVIGGAFLIIRSQSSNKSNSQDK